MSISTAHVPLVDCSVLRVEGPDSFKFIQGLVTNDLHTIAAQKSGYTAWLNNKGRYLFDTIVSPEPEPASTSSSASSTDATPSSFLLQINRPLVPMFEEHLKRYKLRMKAQVTDISQEVNVWSVMSTDTDHVKKAVALNNQVRANSAFVDPRVEALGARIMVPYGQTPVLPEETSSSLVDPKFYDAFRLAHGIPEGSKDMITEKSLPLECNLEWLNGVSFNKGCYLGQELTARTHFQGLLRKRLMPVYLQSLTDDKPMAFSASDSSLSEPTSLFARFPFFNPTTSVSNHNHTLPPNTDITLGSQNVGKLFSSCYNLGLAQMRLDNVSHLFTSVSTAGLIFRAGDYVVIPFVPSWWPADAGMGEKSSTSA